MTKYSKRVTLCPVSGYDGTMKHQEKRKTNSAGCVVYRQCNDSLEILLIKPYVGRDAWGIPKGHQDEGESLVQTAIRETKEEAGVDAAIAGFIGTASTINGEEHKTVYVYFALPVGDDTPSFSSDPDGETADAAWFNIDSLPNIHSYQRDVVANAIDAIRIHASSPPR